MAGEQEGEEFWEVPGEQRVSGIALGKHFGAGEDGIRVGVWIQEGWAVGGPAYSSPPFLVSGGWGVPPQGCARADAALTVRQALVISLD